VAPYLQLNLGVTHRFQDVFGAPLELTGSIINVTDRVYEIRSGTGVGVFAPQYGPRRAFFAGIRKFF
jgi:outer membrane receptor protein involved in Fe transport